MIKNMNKYRIYHSDYESFFQFIRQLQKKMTGEPLLRFYVFDSWASLLAVLYLTWFVLNGMRSVPKLSKQWKRVFIIAQTCSLTFLCLRTFYMTARLSGYDLAQIHKESGDNSPEMVLCSIIFGISGSLITLTYCYYLWFWFIRLEITFARSKTMAISKFEKNVMYAVIIEFHLVSLFFALFRILLRNYQSHEASYCEQVWQLQQYTLIVGLCVIFSYCFVSYLTCSIYICKLRSVLITANQGNDLNTSSELSKPEQLALRKTTFIAITSIICSAIFLTIVMTVQRLHSTVSFDMVLNSLFIACYFKFGESYYNRVFCLCEKHGNRLLSCCHIYMNNNNIDL